MKFENLDKLRESNKSAGKWSINTKPSLNAKKVFEAFNTDLMNAYNDKINFELKNHINSVEANDEIFAKISSIKK